MWSHGKATTALIKLGVLLILENTLKKRVLAADASLSSMNLGQYEPYEASSHHSWMKDQTDGSHWLKLSIGDSSSSSSSSSQHFGQASSSIQHEQHHDAVHGQGSADYGVYPYYANPNPMYFQPGTYGHPEMQHPSEMMTDLTYSHGHLSGQQQISGTALEHQTHANTLQEHQQKKTSLEELLAHEEWRKKQVKETNERNMKRNEWLHHRTQEPLPLVLYTTKETRAMKVYRGTERYKIAAYLEDQKLKEKGIHLGIPIEKPEDMGEERYAPLLPKGAVPSAADSAIRKKQIELDQLFSENGLLKLRNAKEKARAERSQNKSVKRFAKIKEAQRARFQAQFPYNLLPLRLFFAEELMAMGLEPQSGRFRMARYLEELNYKGGPVGLWGEVDLQKPTTTKGYDHSLVELHPLPGYPYMQMKQKEIDDLFRKHNILNEESQAELQGKPGKSLSNS